MKQTMLSPRTQSTNNGKMCTATRKYLCYVLCVVAALFICIYNTLPFDTSPRMIMVNKSPKVIYDRDNNTIPYDKDMPLIFVGGMPRSGTTLMRALLDAHPEVRCGEETRVIPKLLGMRKYWGLETEKNILQEAGITGNVLDAAVTAFLLEIIARHGEAAKYLCNKDPFTLKFSVYLNHLFPNAKFLFVIRDGRATVHSIISREVTIAGFDLKSYRNCLEKWNTMMEKMYAQCLIVGADKCMPVYYEQLVLQPELWMRRITKFLKVPWNDSVLHHEDYIEKPGGIAVSKIEISSDQIRKPINIDSLDKWVGQIPQDVIDDMPNIAPMLRTLGYDPTANPPNYGKPDQQVAENTLHIQQNVEYWKKREEEIMKQNQGQKKVIV